MLVESKEELFELYSLCEDIRMDFEHAAQEQGVEILKTHNNTFTSFMYMLNRNRKIFIRVCRFKKIRIEMYRRGYMVANYKYGKVELAKKGFLKLLKEI